jgi:hypothetical protein
MDMNPERNSMEDSGDRFFAGRCAVAVQYGPNQLAKGAQCPLPRPKVILNKVRGLVGGSELLLRILIGRVHEDDATACARD